MPNSRHYRAKIASLTRSRQPDDSELIDARRDHAVERLAEHITRIVSAAPSLTQAQRDRLSGLLDSSVA